LLGSHIPAGTVIILAPWAVNKDPAMWGPKASEFDPGRWKDPKTGKPNQSGGASTNYAFLTFLHGPRSCIGQGFARAELRALVAAFVGAFEFTMADPDEEVIPAGVVTTKPKDGLKLKLTKIGDWWPQES
jgi:cytochrome P450